MNETVDTIARWSQETFGSVPLQMRVARMGTELVELIDDLLKGKIDTNEFADVYITLASIGMHFGVTQAAIDRYYNDTKLTAGKGPAMTNRLLSNHNRLHTLVAQMDNGLLGHADGFVQGAEVCLDTYACLHEFWFELNGSKKKLLTRINQKMEVNRERKWDFKNGVGQHVES